MMKFGAHIPLTGMPFLHDPKSFPAWKDWQLAAALEIIYPFVKEGKVLGPLPGNTRFCPVTGKPLVFYPSFVVPKTKPGSYRWVLNASYNRGGPSVNDLISDFSTSLIDVKSSLHPCLRTRFMSRIDLKRAFKQLHRTISQMYLLATVVGEFVFIDATMSMGLRNTCKLFEEEFMKAFVRGLLHHHPELFSDALGPLVDNYLDDIWFLADSVEKNRLQILVAEFWARWLGIQLNLDKRELPSSSTRHLGFVVELKRKVVMVTQKHRRKITAYFKNFLVAVRKNERLSVRGVQRMLGLQIWISTVFRVARQFLTSICDILKISAQRTYFYPRRHPGLVARAVRDLTFWRRFVTGTAAAGFDYLLNRMPVNRHRMASDAATSFGMAGVLRFNVGTVNDTHLDGLFWQIRWEEWHRIVCTRGISPGDINIHAAEYLALLITCETFADQCKNRLTYLDIDNTSALNWFEAARCPKYPFDRCGQGMHLYMLERNMKVKTNWVCSAANALADRCSREPFSNNRVGHDFNGVRLRRVKPRWLNVIKFL